MECELLRSPMISYRSLLYNTTVLYDMQHCNLLNFCEINFISKNHAKILLHERSRYSNRAVNFANCIKNFNIKIFYAKLIRTK